MSLQNVANFFRQYCAYHNHTFNFLMQINFLWFDCDNHIKTICCCFWNENIIINKYHKIFAVYGAVTKNCSLIFGYHANGCAQGILFNIPLINKSFMSTLMLPFVQMCHRDHSTHGLSQWEMMLQCNVDSYGLSPIPRMIHVGQYHNQVIVSYYFIFIMGNCMIK